MQGSYIQKVTLSPSSSFTCKLSHPSDALVEWLHSYANRRPLDPRALLPTHEEILLNIPFGEALSYGQVLGRRYARAIGAKCRKNPYPLFVPCHRVIAANGKLGGFAFGSELKRELLRFEGYRLTSKGERADSAGVESSRRIIS